MAANYERGGQDPLRVLGTAAASDQVQDEPLEGGEDRLDQLPDHERDRDTSQGAGLTSSGVMAEERGSSEAQPLASDQDERDTDEGPLGDKGYTDTDPSEYPAGAQNRPL